MAAKNFGKKISDRIINLSILATVAAFTIFGGFLLPFDIGVLSAPPTTPVVSIDKKFVVGASETDNITTAAGSTVTARLYYNNTGDTPGTGASLKTTLPAGFVYVPGSTKNCITPSSTETICDAATTSQKNIMFSNLTGVGMSPTAGLYDAASPAATGGTDTSATSGLVEIGKKRYVNQTQCTDTGLPGYFGFYYGDPSTLANKVSNTPTYLANTYSNGITECAATVGGTPNSSSFTVSWDLFSKRYINQVQCVETNQNFSGFYLGAASTFANKTSNFPLYGINAYNGNASGCAATLPYSYGPGSNEISLDILGQRYINQTQCAVGTKLKSFYFGAPGTLANKTSTTALYGENIYSVASSECTTTLGNGYGVFTSNSQKISLDLLDVARGSGYVEYKMVAPSPATSQNFVQAESIVGSNFVTANDSGNITINPIPPTTIAVVNLSTGTCTSQVVGTPTTCQYPLVGDSYNNYALPGGGITATVPGSP
ncbi:MAG: hypothetical protein H7230_01260 [Candidatus Parcubacteria bacterium]|nr:hypothetical protein [Candidatus Paceibacterota bacterium]